MEQEQEPTREIHEPVEYDCGRCGDIHQTLFENTLVMKYAVDTWANRLITKCDSNNFWSIFFLNGDEVNMWAEQFTQVVGDDEEPLMFCDDEEVHELYRQFKGIELIEEKELTSKENKLANFFAWFIDKYVEELLEEE